MNSALCIEVLKSDRVATGLKHGTALQSHTFCFDRRKLSTTAIADLAEEVLGVRFCLQKIRGFN